MAEVEGIPQFEWPEYFVFGALLVLSMGIGVFYGCFKRKNVTNEEFLMAGRSMSVLPVTLSVLCSFISAITLLGNPVEVYFYGMQYTVQIVSLILMTIALAYFYLPVYFDLQLTSAFEYFELRFNKHMRFCICTSQVVHALIYMPLTVYGPSIALEQVAGFNSYLSSAIIFIVCIAYSSLGGLKAVLWTDALQAFVMFASLISVIAVGIGHVGGLSYAWDLAEATGRTEFFSFDTDLRTRHTFWTCLIGAYFYWSPIFLATQSQIQRYLSVPTMEKARLCIWLNLLGLMSIIAICGILGLLIFAKYAACDPVTFGRVTSSDQLLPLFVMDVMGSIPGLPGLFVAGITSGSMSTVSSSLNSLSAMVTEDYVKKWRSDLSDETMGKISRIVSVVGGLIAFAGVFLIAAVGNILPFSSVLHALFLGPILGVFSLGMFFPWSNWIGILLGVIPSTALMLFLGIGSVIAGNQGKLPNQKLPFLSNSTCDLNSTRVWEHGTGKSTLLEIIENTHYEVTQSWKDEEQSSLIKILSMSYLWPPVVPVVLTVILGLVFSLIVSKWKKFPKVEERCLSPLMVKLWIKVFGLQKMSEWIQFGAVEQQHISKNLNQKT